MNYSDAGLKFTEEVVDICKPLESLGITYFNHIKVFHNNSRISLGNNRAWLEHFIRNNYHLKGHFSRNPKSLTEKYYLWTNLPPDGVMQDARQNFDIANGLTIVEKSDNSVSAYIFATNSSNQAINNFYFNHLDLLKKFIDYYHDVAANLIKKSRPVQIYTTSINEDNNDLCVHNDGKRIETFNSLVSAKRFFVEAHNKEFKLSKVQHDLIALMLEGKSIKEISIILGIKPGSCYKYIEILKEHLSFPTTRKLLEFFSKRNLA